MKPLHIIVGVAVVTAVLAGFALFLLVNGSEGPSQDELATENAGPATEAGQAGPSANASASAPGADAFPQQDTSTNQPQGGIVVSPALNLPGGSSTGGVSLDIPQQQGESPQHLWQADGLTDLEADVARHLAEISHRAPKASVALAGVDWLANQMTVGVGIAVPFISEMAVADPELALTVATLPWVADEELKREELTVLAQLSQIAAVSPDLAASLAGSQLLDEEITETREATMGILQAVAAQDSGLAVHMADSPEVADGISKEELAAFTGSQSYFVDVTRQHSPAAAEILLGYPWVASSTSWSLERDETGPDSPGILASPLPQDAESEHYQQYALGNVAELATLDPELAERVAGYPWLADGLTQLERRILFTLLLIARNDLEAARRLAGLPWMADQPTIDQLEATRVVWLLTEYSPALVNVLLNQAWFQDTISKAEGALLSVMDMGCNYYAYCQQLIEGGQVEWKTLFRPTGDVEVFAVSRSPLGGAAQFIFDGTQLTVDSMEELIGPAWPKPRVVVYLEPEFEHVSDTRGLQEGNFVMISESHPGRTDSYDVLFHELAHYYKIALRSAWAHEGVTSFFDSYVFFASGVQSMMYRYERAQQSVEISCIPKGESNLYERILATEGWSYATWLWERGCDYYLGERFMWALYIDLGHDMVADSLQEMHGIRAERRILTEEEAYAIFLSHTPPEKRQLFQDLYTCFHGMPIAGQIPSPSADCDNLPLGPGSEVREPTLLVEALAPKPQPTPTRPAQVLDDRKTLLAINEAIGNVLPWEEADQMNHPLSAWKGVFFTDATGHVTGLNLNGVKFNGPMPPEIGNLAHLEWLTMINSDLTGPLPPELGNLVNLTKLELNSNRITGPLPPELGNLVQLEELDLAANEVDGPLPRELGNLTSLTYMDFTQNKLSGSIPSEIGNLAALQHLSLNNNQLSGAIPAELGNLVNLTALNLGTNQLSGQIPAELANLTKLNVLILLDFSGNEYTGCIPAGLPDAQVIDVDRIGLPGC